VGERSKQARATDLRAVSAATRPPEPAQLKEALVAQLDDIEKRLAGDHLDPPPADGSVEQFVTDVAREARGVGARLLRVLSGPRQIVGHLVEALAGPQPEATGVDERLRDAVAEVLRPLARSWLGLRLRTDIPLAQRGPVLVTLNRSGWPLPTEALVIGAAIAERARRHDVYILWDADLANVPALGGVLRRIGVLPAERETVRRLLGLGALVICFPEGRAARGKDYASRYRLTRFADGFLIDEARARNVPVVPGAIIGHEESYPVLGRLGGLPLTPTFPLTGVLGLLPLPLGWRARTGIPVAYDEHGAGADDLTATVRARMQSMIGDVLAERRSIIRG
jgi:1-acyl-sn-glycerol-3-phosphate acyltransferase